MRDVFLIGPKHSGKTTVGKALAKICACEFIDLDEMIKERTGKSPRRLFKESRAVFQEAELKAAEALFASGEDSAKGQRIIATGGGIIDNAEAVSLLKKNGVKTVYLNISAESAWDRIANAADGELPPFLQTENPQETHRVLHERRAAAYKQFNADIVIEVAGKSAEENAGEIKRRLN